MAQGKHVTVVDISIDPQGGTTVHIATTAAVEVNIPAPAPQFSVEVEQDVVYSGAVTGQYVDSCETCTTVARGWYLRPVAAIDSGKGSVIAHYAHRRCGKRWNASWAKQEAPGVGIIGDPEPSPLGGSLRAVVAGLRREAPSREA